MTRLKIKREITITPVQCACLAAATVFSMLYACGGGYAAALVFFIISAASSATSLLLFNKERRLARSERAVFAAVSALGAGIVIQKLSFGVASVSGARIVLVGVLSLALSLGAVMLSVRTLGRFSAVMVLPCIVVAAAGMISGGEKTAPASGGGALYALLCVGAMMALTLRTAVSGDEDMSDSAKAEREEKVPPHYRAIPVCVGSALGAGIYSATLFFGVKVGALTTYFLWITHVIGAAVLLILPAESIAYERGAARAAHTVILSAVFLASALTKI